jgi:hypothetical protein
MSRYGYPGTNTLASAAIIVLCLALAGGFAACIDEPTRPPRTGEEAILRPGVNVYLTMNDDAAALGSRVRVTGKVRAVGVDVTPTGFYVDLMYDPEKLEPVEAATLDDGVLRAVNLEAGPGIVKVAGAAPNGLASDVLFAIEMKVKADEYANDLGLSVNELTVVEKDFMDVASDVVMPPRALVVGR